MTLPQNANPGSISPLPQAPREPDGLLEVAEGQTPHIPALDGLRGLAITLAMLSHTTVIVPANAVDRWFRDVVDVGWVGVDLFFVLSGFLITGILYDSRHRKNYFRNFYARRALRIFPLYYAFLVVMLLIVPRLPVAAVAEQGRVEGGGLWYWLYASNLRYALHGFDSQILNVTWSLAVEEHFYLVWPTLVFWLRRETLLWLCGALIAAALLIRVGCGLRGTSVAIPYTFTLCRMDSLAAGAAVALLARGGGLRAWRSGALVIGWSAAVAFAALVVAGRSTFWGNPWLSTVGFTAAAGLFAALLIQLLTADRRSLLARFFNGVPLRTLGKYSYCLYLTHAIVRSGLRDWVYPPGRFLSVGGSQIPGQLLFYVMVFSASLAVAKLSWELFERPILTLKRFFPADNQLRGVLERGGVR